MANLKNTNIDNNLELPQGTTGQRPSSPQEGQIRYNTDLETAEFYNGANWRPLSDTHAEATGGTVVDTDIGGVPYRIHYFTEVGTDTLTVTNPGEVEYLIVAGGGSGGAHNAGGGGAGGLLTGHTAITAQTYTITVGAGGLAVTNAVGNNGNNSSAFGLTAIGGGRGGSQSGNPSGPPLSGGSGGGAGGTQSGAAGTAGQGNTGGNAPNATGGGGGGAGSPGTAYANNKAGDGGHGIYNTILGTGYFWAGGGGGSIYGGSGFPLGSAGDGGLGGGGGGGHRAAGPGEFGLGGTGGITVGQDGTRGSTDSGGNGGSNTGSGGGGSNGVSTSGSGGSGIVIIRYPRNSSLDSEPDRTVVATQPNNFQTVRDGLVLELDAANLVSYPGTGTTWRDLSGNGYNATLVNSPIFTSAQGGYFTFNGSNQTASVLKPFPNITGTITQEIWLYFNTLISNISVVHKGEHYTLRINANNTYSWADSTVYSYSSYGTRNAEGISTVGIWKHIVVTKDSANAVRLYINGVLVDTRTSFGSAITAVDSTLWIVGYSDTDSAPTAPIDGRVSATSIYNRALSAQEIQQNFNALRGRYGI